MQRPFIIHALSPLHPGTGQAQGAVDLPIARLRGTGIPFLPGSSIKGVLREAAQRAVDGLTGPKDGAARKLSATFGPAVNEQDDRHAGAISFGDARLLALPIRSFVGTFAWVTSPLLLHLARRDLEKHAPPDVPNLGTGKAHVTTGTALVANGHLFLEELDCEVRPEGTVLADRWAEKISSYLALPDRTLFTKRFAIVDDETMTYLWECGTQVDARVRIDREKGVVQEGALWYEESLPAETLLLGLAVGADRLKLQAAALMEECLGASRTDLQFGGKATVGRGRAALHPVK